MGVVKINDTSVLTSFHQLHLQVTEIQPSAPPIQDAQDEVSTI